MLPSLFPKRSSGSSPAKTIPASIRFAPILPELARTPTDAVFARMKTAAEGLGDAEAARRLEADGPNVVVGDKHRGWAWRLLTAARNPLVILLGILAGVSLATGDARAASVMGLMVVLGVSLRFVQESRADAAAAKLKAMITVTTTVVRAGRTLEIPLKDLVAGDVVTLAAGDMIPADVRVVAAKDLFVTQAALTGESMPVEKFAVPETRADVAPLEAGNLAFLGTSVESGAATAVVLATGPRTYFGGMAGSITGAPVETSFDRGMKDFTWLMIGFIGAMVPLVFVINGLTKHNWHEAFFFSVAVAVGLTPEMLPMIVSVCLSKGALAMSRKKVIVKQLGAIQNFGAMDVLCTDKTGTLTMDQVILERHCDVMQKESQDVLLHAYLISHFQTGLRNVLDRAILRHREAHEQLSVENYRKVDEIPFDFTRRMMSVVVETPDGDHQLLTKGAPEAVFPRCTSFELDGEIFPMEPILVGDLMQQYQELSADGFRVLAVAQRHFDEQPHITKDDERDLVLKGYIAFLDPPKDSAARAIRALQGHGVTVKVLTGDNDLVTRKVCRDVGLDPGTILLGGSIETMTDDALAGAVETTHVFARLSPAHKQRIIRALQKRGHVVGFMGDGINDSPALHVADVGISVDSAVDIAKAAAGVILLEKDLMVLDDGVIEGRKVFVNILKYVRMGASSNFGNMFSVLGASAFLPFVPMAPIQVLANNLLYDFSQIPIPTDNVGEEQTAKPRPWHIGDIRKFVLFIGPVSSIFDYTTFLVMFRVFGCSDTAHAPLFQTGWFVESLVTQTLIIHVIRTNRLPFVRGRASWQVSVTTVLVMGIAMWLPASPLAAALGFVPLPPLYWPILGATALCYVVLTQTVKTWLLRRMWI
ncbi:MAG: magnesium-translocating P-type ATPase [Verrucomicrobia bacterium]|nr:MAG: magnesium-translocating P-type ATPase [Verrucomicrobiota bacterium]